MKYKLSRTLGIQVPPDGFTQEEKELEDLISGNVMRTVYSKLPTTRMKFIVAAHYELGYPQQLIAEVLGVKQPTLAEELNLIKMVLSGHHYRPRKFKDGLNSEHLLSFLVNSIGL